MAGPDERDGVTLRPELAAIVAALLRRSESTRAVSLDDVGEALGARAISPDEVDAILGALEAAGRRVVAPEGGGGEARLKSVLAAARDIRESLGRTPTVDEIAARSGLPAEHVRHALALARVIQR